MKCINLIKCPICKNEDIILMNDELGLIYSMGCSECNLVYGDIMEKKSTLYNPFISDDTYKEVCDIWQKNACRQWNIEYIPCKYI